MENDFYPDGCIRSIYWQLLVDRAGAPVGYECLVRLAGVSDRNTEKIFNLMPAKFLYSVTSELLFRLSLNCVFNNFSEGKPLVKLFLNIEKDFFLCRDAVSELISASVLFSEFGYQLVVEITERPLKSRASLRNYIDGLIRLTQNKIPLVLDDYMLSNDENIELELGLISLVKFDVETLGIPLLESKCNFDEQSYIKLRDNLYEFVHAYRVPLLAEKVENSWQFEILSGLPFRYFQGFYFGRPNTAENGVIPTACSVASCVLEPKNVLHVVGR